MLRVLMFIIQQHPLYTHHNVYAPSPQGSRKSPHESTESTWPHNSAVWRLRRVMFCFHRLWSLQQRVPRTMRQLHVWLLHLQRRRVRLKKWHVYVVSRLWLRQSRLSFGMFLRWRRVLCGGQKWTTDGIRRSSWRPSSRSVEYIKQYGRL